MEKRKGFLAWLGALFRRKEPPLYLRCLGVHMTNAAGRSALD